MNDLSKIWIGLEHLEQSEDWISEKLASHLELDLTPLSLACKDLRERLCLCCRIEGRKSSYTMAKVPSDFKDRMEGQLLQRTHNRSTVRDRTSSHKLPKLRVGFAIQMITYIRLKRRKS